MALFHQWLEASQSWDISLVYSHSNDSKLFFSIIIYVFVYVGDFD